MCKARGEPRQQRLLRLGGGLQVRSRHSRQTKRRLGEAGLRVNWCPHLLHLQSITNYLLNNKLEHIEFFCLGSMYNYVTMYINLTHRSNSVDNLLLYGLQEWLLHFFWGLQKKHKEYARETTCGPQSLKHTHWLNPSQKVLPSHAPNTESACEHGSLWLIFVHQTEGSVL